MKIPLPPLVRRVGCDDCTLSIGGGSPAHGDTLNPWDTRRTSGGSSSGEGALRLGALWWHTKLQRVPVGQDFFCFLLCPVLRVGGGASPFGIGALDRNQESAIDLLQPMVRGTLFSGTDVGGSVRIPSAYCGISALKPTLGRLAADSANLEFVLHNSWQCGCAHCGTDTQSLGFSVVRS